MNKENENCSNCMFVFQGDEKIPPHCRRQPPEAMAVPTTNRFTQKQEMSVHPLPHPLPPTNWCGEYKPLITIEQ